MPAPSKTAHITQTTSSLPAKLDYLFRNRLRPVDAAAERRLLAEPGAEVPTREYRYNEVAEAIGSTPSYVSMIRHGQRTNPNLEVVRGLARFFGVPVAYLVEEEPNLGPDGKPRTLAERLELLFDIVRPAGRDARYTDLDVAAAVGSTPQQIADLRSGTCDDPPLKIVQALARFFDVPVAYLADDDATALEIDRQLGVLRGLRERDTLDMALRMSLIRTPQGRAMMQSTLDGVLSMESAPLLQLRSA